MYSKKISRVSCIPRFPTFLSLSSEVIGLGSSEIILKTPRYHSHDSPRPKVSQDFMYLLGHMFPYDWYDPTLQPQLTGGSFYDYTTSKTLESSIRKHSFTRLCIMTSQKTVRPLIFVFSFFSIMPFEWRDLWLPLRVTGKGHRPIHWRRWRHAVLSCKLIDL